FIRVYFVVCSDPATIAFSSLSLHDALPILFFVGSYFVPEAQAYLPMYYFESDMFKFWQPITHMFMHGSPMHLLFNMFGLYMFGSDRKSTRLNSSHVKISYAVFCLKKKKKYK